jgi:hypothetical protein
MQIVRKGLAIFLMMWLIAPRVSAQPIASSSSDGQAAIDRALAARAAAVDADRDVVRRVLDRTEVRDVAARMGVDIARVQASVSLLDAAELAQAADQARAVEDTLAGGATTVVITTTTIIIALLIVIIIVLLAD